MATSNFPVSTRIWDFWVNQFNFFVFVTFGNPLSMFVMNLLAPRLTHLWAQNKTYFGSCIYAFYTSLALKMPFRWAKWWLDQTDAAYLQEFSTKQQVSFFNKVSPTVQTFNALSSEANIALIQQLSKEQLYALMPQIRFSQNVLTYLRQSGHFNILHEYIRHGALSIAALRDFVEFVTIDSPYYEQKIRFLEAYAMRYKLTETDMNALHNRCMVYDLERLQRANLCYEQCRKVRCFCGLINEQEEKRWAEYCRKNKLEPEAQAEMNLKQYKIFADLGKHLAPKAIITLLKKPDEKYWQQIFTSEPPTVFNTLDMAYIFLENPKLQKMFHDSVATLPKG